MIEIHPVFPALPIVKLKKIHKDEHPTQQQHHEQKPAPQPNPQEPDSVQHIDEIV
ncbi:MAG: hypothetical protein Q8N35_12430 [Methylococcaceae bacterium]|jgi:hypothetical protein|nr:hypothetical protein [Methylococcaceae bacterium]MDZ4158065.1 hypothetical protein [Methylococcales bacterium]MDP2392856.1 hypothetical protein [Methylococcaceae bacterium]MDP3020384.1 hypothetical protein [Methylococcaceae bacterium]MDP3391991.1 hypothetical protein [Methylococcaceae bacterium]